MTADHPTEETPESFRARQRAIENKVADEGNVPGTPSAAGPLLLLLLLLGGLGLLYLAALNY
jgi:hypothetical protein